MSTKKYFRTNRQRSKYNGGSSFEQKGVAAQLRPSTPHNSILRKKLNEIVHSGDFYESKERNGFLNLENDFDPEAQVILNEAVDYIKNNKDLNTKIKKRVLQGIAPVTVTIPSIATTSYRKTSTKRMKTGTPTKNTITSTMTKSSNSSRSRRQRRTRRKFKS